MGFERVGVDNGHLHVYFLSFMGRQKRRKKRVRIGQRHTVEIVGMGPGGWGVGGVGDRRVFVRHGLPGDRLDVCVVRQERGRVEAVIERVYDRVVPVQDPPCGHANICGGCLWQHVPYETQLDLKRQMVAFCFSERRLDAGLIRPVLKSPDLFAYRNKMDFTFGSGHGDRAVLGLYERSRGSRRRGEIPPVFDVMHCGLQSEAGNRIVPAIRRAIVASALPVYRPENQEGVLRSLVIREGLQTGEALVQFVASADCREALKPVADAVMQAEPSVCGVVLSVNPRRSKNAAPETRVVLAGRDAIFEKIRDLQIRVSPTSFLQINTRQAEQLYARAVACAELTSSDDVLDLYCGTGTLSLLLAQKARSVTGIEVAASAVADAEENARQNGVENVRFLCGDVLDILPDLLAENPVPGVVAVNPPRAGVFRQVVERICALAPRRVVYVSCNPETLARDLVRFLAGGYALRSVQPVDMFPHTPHIEVVVRLDKR